MAILRFIAYLVDIVTSVVMVLLGVRLAFKMFNANTGAWFVRSVYAITNPTLPPFRNIFPSQELSPGFVIEFSTLLALVVYALIGYVVIRVIDVIDETVLRKSSRTSVAA
ncbi:MAG: YggT family protein [Candidatus Uhrbacteria bacterium]|nr:YggT family protein [Candidatus Uhrbacteria bacterium]